MARIGDPLTINGVTFANRLVRSSVGGRTAAYDGTVTGAWKNFEKRFAEGGVAGIVSTTFNVSPGSQSPFEYPRLHADRFVAPLARCLDEIRATGCRYVVQIGDPGYHNQMGLFSERHDALSASGGLDLVYGYRNTRIAMSDTEVASLVGYFVDAAARVVRAGADGLEVTAAKGYVIHQFLNPGTNRRTDRWGGSEARRFRLLGEVVQGVRRRIGPEFLFGVRISAEDWNHAPLNLRWPPSGFGNRLEVTLRYARRLKDLGVDYLHVVSGFGFPHPRVTPGPFPFEEIRQFFNSVRHLSFKAGCRAALFNACPAVARRVANSGWRYEEGINLGYARAFRAETGLPVISNGGFQRCAAIDAALERGDCDLVSMARALIANPDLPRRLAASEEPRMPCTFCNRCVGRTGTSPLGCYDPSRFSSQAAMESQILDWNRP